MRRSWLARPDPAVAAADRRAAALGPAAHAALLAAGDRLAETSALLALRAYEHAAAAWLRFGETGFRRWMELGADLACGEPACREGALAYFRVAPDDFGPGGLDTAAAWCGLGREVAVVSRRLAVAFFERTTSVLRRPDALPRLRGWVDAGLPLYETRGWRGAFLAQAFFEAAPDALGVLGPADYRPWAEAGAALADAAGERQFFAAVPPALGAWSDDERARFLAATVAFAHVAPRSARAFYRELPPALAGLPPDVRAALLRTLAAIDPRIAPALAELVPVVGAVVREVPHAERLDALGQVDALAAGHPDAAVAALRVLPRLYEEAAPADVRRWFAAGAAIAAENAVAGRAYFGLESRTSVRVLRAGSTAATLEETEGVWRKLVQMLSGEGVTVRGIDGFSLRPPLEDVPAEREVGLPIEVDLLPTHEENCRLYRFLATQLAGRREFGTYADESLRARLRDPAEPELLEDLVLVAEGVRVHHRLAAAYAGLAGEAEWAGTRLLERWRGQAAPARTAVLDALLAVVLGARARPSWLPADVVALVAQLTAPLASAAATIEDSVRIGRALAAALGTPALLVREALAEADLLLIDDLTGGDALVAFDGEASEPAWPARPDRPGFEPSPVALAPDVDERAAGGRPLGIEELRRLLEAGVRIGQGRGASEGGAGLPITALLGKLAAEDLDAVRRLLDAGTADPARRASGAASADDHTFAYDEWDHRIADYRTAWCRLREVTLPGDSGEFFGRTLAEYARLLPEVRRQFQRLRPEMYRTIRGLEDGEDFDLNAVTDARIEVRARRAPSTRLYRSRIREARDVATLFLLDMSASTDEPLAPGRRIIDALKEALVIMTEALDELGDAYAIYGFSGQGRSNVEFYLVKGFAERLGSGVKARIGGIAPRRSTRMGTAVRHAARKMAAVGARSKHLMLLSDGFPQDEDYGDDRRSHVYGIRDTAVALREADAAGITPFCITVDRAGHDYLREMCDASRYMVIDDIGGLPRELPKIYRRVVRA